MSKPGCAAQPVSRAIFADLLFEIGAFPNFAFHASSFRIELKLTMMLIGCGDYEDVEDYEKMIKRT